ncbi:MAG: ribosome maturation factor RimP [Candidatus Cloacimonetes bacterium]|nr:ribosome maturation factor RimP [Candidatus Cloacimonadota bacterium]
MKNDLMLRLEELTNEVCRDQGVSLYDIGLKNAQKGKILVVYITKIGGVSLGDCQQVSIELGNMLEVEDLIPERYFLEVSSPGLERDLRLKKHYVSAINEKVKITYNREGHNITSLGTLKEVLVDHLILDIEGEEVAIFFTDIKKARTYFDYKR